MDPATLLTMATMAEKFGGADAAASATKVAGVAGAVPGAVQTATALIPGELEKEQKKEYEGIRALVAKGKGGLEDWRKKREEGEIAARGAKARAAMAAKFGRGSAVMGGAGGVPFQQLQEFAKTTFGREAQERSKLREADLAMAVKLREYANNLRNQIMARKREDAALATEGVGKMMGIPTGSPEADIAAANQQQQRLQDAADAERYSQQMANEALD